MDGSNLFPDGFHPVCYDYTLHAVHLLKSRQRIDTTVMYFSIDFGMSTWFMLGESSDESYVVGTKGRDQDVPELSLSKPYDAFKSDKVILGNVYRKDFLHKYDGVDFLEPLRQTMTDDEPSTRCTATEALSTFNTIVPNLTESSLRWRLAPKDESIPSRVVYDTVAIAREGLHSLMKSMGQWLSTV